MNTSYQPIFILGICPRSGTNLIYNLLQKHPDCVAASRGGQDNLLYAIDHLDFFVKKTASYWKDHWGQSADALRENLALGILSYLSPKEQTAATHFVTKTPNTFHIDKFFKFFPNTRLIIIIRNGPDAIESGIRSFRWNFDDALRMYADSCKRINKFMRENMAADSWKVIRFEELVANEDNLQAEILDFCQLDQEKLNNGAIFSMPVIGSSDLRTKQTDKMHWTPIPKTKEFTPTDRSKTWTKFQHWRYNSVCGRYATELGYPLKHVSLGPLFYIYNVFRDLNYFFFRVFRKLRLRLPKSKV